MATLKFKRKTNRHWVIDGKNPQKLDREQDYSQK